MLYNSINHGVICTDQVVEYTNHVVVCTSHADLLEIDQVASMPCIWQKECLLLEDMNNYT